MMIDIVNQIRKIKIKHNSKNIVYTLSHKIGERNLLKYDSLLKTENFIYDQFCEYNNSVTIQRYQAQGKTVSNIIAEIKGTEKSDQIILIGAHYDTVEGSPGANDNASAIAALIELLRLSQNITFKHTILFCAFTLEEPPHYSTNEMGSMYFAEYARKQNLNIKLMIALDMLGYGSKLTRQKYPFDNSLEKYPSTGNYLAVVSLPSNAPYAFIWKKIYNRFARNKIYDMIGPASIPGINLSDHFSFHQFGYPAIMLSDTGYYRNPNYHTSTDTYDTMNYSFLSNNILNILHALIILDDFTLPEQQ